MSNVKWGTAPDAIKEIAGSTEGVNGFKPDVLEAARKLAVSGVKHDETGSKINAPLVASTIDRGNGIA